MLSMPTAGRVAALVFALGGVGSTLTALHLDPGHARLLLLACSLTGVLLGVAIWNLPWERLPTWTVFALMPPGYALVVAGNLLQPRPAVAAVYFAIGGIWTGMVGRPGTALVAGPVLAAVYAATMAGDDLSAALRVAPYVAALGAGTGELISRLAARMRRAESRLHDLAERRFEAMVERSGEVTSRAHHDGSITYVSPSARQMLGHEPRDLVGMHLDDYVDGYIHDDDRTRARAFLSETFRVAGSESGIELRILHGDGQWRDIEVRAANLSDNEAVGGVVFNLHDVSERKALERELSRQAFTDPLTGLANRAAFRRCLTDAVGTTVMHGRRLALLFVDIDGFKSVNDHLGHDVGDALLVDIARSLQWSARQTVAIARLGGDEFAVLLDGATAATAEQVASRILRAVQRTVDLGPSATRITTSIGIADLHAGGTSSVATMASDLLRRADIAMYEAKRAGGDRWAADETVTASSRAPATPVTERS